MKYWLLLVIASFCNSYLHAQVKAQRQIKGYLIDTASGHPVTNATVALLYAKDSSMVASSFTDESGLFLFNSTKEGDYKLYITYLGYRSILRSLVIDASIEMIDLDTIWLEKRALTLGAIEIIETRTPMVVKRDTLEFNAGYFKTREYAVVEELLKRLPGVQIDREGTIKMNGVTVKKLLVDGKPFFGDDPLLATRNLTADMIEKVQFIDRKTDWAQFTGINDGQTVKTINITIKKEKKKGYFGRAAGSYGVEDYFAVNGNINRFSDEEQLAFVGNSSNINGYQDAGGQSKIGIGGNGDVRNWNGGGNYSKDFSKELRVGGSYYINKSHTESRRKSERQNLLPDTTWYYNQNSHSSDNNTNHTLNVWAEFKPDTMYMINLSANLAFLNGNNLQENQYASLAGGRQLVNTGSTSLAGITEAPNFSTSIFFGRKFKKRGRALSASLSIGYDTNKQESYNKSDNLFIQPTGEKLTDTINQRSDISGRHRSIALSLAYMEPLFKDSYLELNYTFSRDHALLDKVTNDYNVSKNAYDRLNDSLTNYFENISIFQSAGTNLHIQKEKYDYSIGLNMQLADLDNNNISQRQKLQQYTANFSPSAGFSYGISQNKRLRFNYSGNTQKPSAAQLQPVPDNSNPLYIQKGNPELMSSFSNTFSMGYNAHNSRTFRIFSINGSGSFILNKIINANWFDSLGRQVSQPQNVNGSYSLTANIDNSFPLKRLQTAVNTGTSLSFNRDISYINGVKGSIRNFSIGQNLSFNYAHKDLFDFAANTNASYNTIQYSVQKDNNTHYLNYSFSFDCNVRFPLGFSTGGNLDYLLNTGRAGGYEQDVAMLNMFISKTIFKHRQGLIRIQGFDLLNRNVGITRNVGDNYIEDVQTKVQQRLFLFSFSYFLKK